MEIFLEFKKKDQVLVNTNNCIEKLNYNSNLYNFIKIKLSKLINQD